MSQMTTKSFSIAAGDIAYLAVLAMGAVIASVHVSLGLYHMAIISGLMTGLGLGMLAVEKVPAVGRTASPRLRLATETPAPAAAMGVRVAGVSGHCAWGYRAGNAWAVEATGRVEPPLCGAALVALRPLLQAGQGDGERLAACRCPLPNREVVFAVS